MPHDPARDLARYIDHTLLRPEATGDDIDRLCEEALAWGFAAVCVNPCWVERAARRLEGSGIAVASVCGFPLGASTSDTKAQEAARAAASGAREIDMVQNIGWAKEGDWGAVERDVAAVVEAVSPYDAEVKVILECGLLSDAEKEEGARRAVAAGAGWVKTSTGFLAGGATVHDVALLARAVAGRARVKAAGGIRTLGHARAMLAAGAARIGTSSGVAIVRGDAGDG